MSHRVLNSLNLPACIEEEGGADVPKSVLEKGDALREKGGVENLQKMISELPELLQRNKEIANEVSGVTIYILCYYGYHVLGNTITR